jgi:predicted dehydrogenase
LIRSSRADALVVATPPESHAALLRIALEAGLIAISDKPLTADVVSSRALVEATASNPSKGVVTFQWRHHPGIAYLRDQLANAVIGTLSHLDIRFHHDFLSAQETGCPWRHRADQAGAGTLGDQGVHLFDIARFVSGQEWSVVSAVGHRMWPRRSFNGATIDCETEDVADVTLKAEHGLQLAFIHTSRVATGIRALLLRAYGTAGTIELDVHPDTGSGTLRHLTASGERFSETYNAPSLNPYVSLLGGDRTTDHRSNAGFADGLAAQCLLETAVSSMKHHN